MPGGAWAEFGATATHPNMGRSGTEYLARCSPGFSGVATPRSRSRCQRTFLKPSFIFTARSLSTPRSTMPSSLIGPIAIQAQAREVYRQHVAGSRCLDIERSGLRIAAEDARHAFFVGAPGVDRGGVDRVAWGDGEHGLVRRRKLAIESGRREIVPLRRAAAALGNRRGREGVSDRVLLIVGVDKDDRPGNGGALHGACQFLRAAALVLGQKVDGVAVERALQLVSAELTRELIPLLREFHWKVDGRAVEIGGGKPPSRNGGGLAQQQSRDQEQQRHRLRHGDIIDEPNC